MVYMLDTDTCAFILRGPTTALVNRINLIPLRQQVISTVTLAELLYGLQLATRKKANQVALDAMLRCLTVLEWSANAASHYADIRAQLRRAGQQIGANDLLIAAHARSLGATIVTNNVKDFARVKNLAVENWTAE